MYKKINWFLLFLIVLITQIVGVLGSLVSGDVSQIYSDLTLPPLSPPGWLFGSVWFVLYLLMGIAAYIIYISPKSPQRNSSIYIYWIQLFINFLWPIVFFRFNAYWIAAGVIILLDLFVIINTIMFFKVNKTAGFLFIPYLIWILFATYLNISIALLN